MTFRPTLPLYRLLLAASLLVVSSIPMLVATPTASAASLGCADDAAGLTDLPGWIPSMLRATNDYRASKGLPALKLDATLSKASLWKARDMARRNYFSHDDPASGGAAARSPWDRLAACGYTANARKQENIAAGQQSGAAFVQAWINSPPHRENLENAEVRYIGFGVSSSPSSTYNTYAVQMFASLPGPAAAAPAVPPAAPSATALAFAGPAAGAKLVCPPIAASGTRFVPDAVVGPVTASTSSAGCLRVDPNGVGAATISYHAAGPTGLRSGSTTMTVIVDAGRRPMGTGGAAPFDRAALTRVTASVLHGRRLSVHGRLGLTDGSSLAGQRLVVLRRGASGRWIVVGRTRSTGRGAFSLTVGLPVPAHGGPTWLARNAASIRVTYAGSSGIAGASRTARSRR